MAYWLFKSEPTEFSIADLAATANHTVVWDGIRNYQARNYLRDQVKLGDHGFFYHSGCAQPGIVGIVTVVSDAYPDAQAWCESSPYYDAKSSPTQPKWFAIDLKLYEQFSQRITLSSIKQDPKLATMTLLTTQSRLSIMPISPEAWTAILAKANH